MSEVLIELKCKNCGGAIKRQPLGQAICCDFCGTEYLGKEQLHPEIIIDADSLATSSVPIEDATLNNFLQRSKNIDDQPDEDAVTKATPKELPKEPQLKSRNGLAIRWGSIAAVLVVGLLTWKISVSSAINRHMSSASKAMESGEWDRAESEYRDILLIDSTNEAATQGIKDLQGYRVIRNAQEMASKPDWQDVESHLKPVMPVLKVDQNPKYKIAEALLNDATQHMNDYNEAIGNAKALIERQRWQQAVDYLNRAAQQFGMKTETIEAMLAEAEKGMAAASKTK